MSNEDRTIPCGLCDKRFNPHDVNFEVVDNKWLCCAANYTPEELAEELDISVKQAYEDQGLKYE